MHRLIPCSLLLLLCACHFQDNPSGYQAPAVQPQIAGEDVITLNWDIDHNTRTMRLRSADDTACIDFSRPLDGPHQSLTGSWSNEWTEKHDDTATVHQYLFHFAADGSCCYREQQGSRFTNIYGDAETVYADVYIAYGRWRKGNDSRIYIVFDQTKTLTPLRQQKIESSIL
jgi:hypothetical protein